MVWPKPGKPDRFRRPCPKAVAHVAVAIQYNKSLCAHVINNSVIE